MVGGYHSEYSDVNSDVQKNYVKTNSVFIHVNYIGVAMQSEVSCFADTTRIIWAIAVGRGEQVVQKNLHIVYS